MTWPEPLVRYFREVDGGGSAEPDKIGAPAPILFIDTQIPGAGCNPGPPRFMFVIVIQ